MVYLSTYLTPHTETFGDIGLLRSVFHARMGRRVQLLFIAGSAGAEGATGGYDDDATAASGVQTGKSIIARAANDLRHHYADRDGIQAKVLRMPYLYTASSALTDPFFGAVVRGMLGRVGRASGCGRCAVSPAVCQGTRGVGASYL